MNVAPKKIGFFHFGSEQRRNPAVSLEKSIEQAGGTPYVRESIIVLPEAFNIGAKYEDNGEPFNRDPDIKCRLKAIAAKFECAFVAGLIVGAPGEAQLPNSSADFIDATSWRALSLKKGEDHMARIAYEPSTSEKDSPIIFGGTIISALICMDAYIWPTSSTLDTNRSRHERLREKITNLGASCPILCVPANTKQFSTAELSDDWPGFHVVLANGYSLSRGDRRQCPSVIKMKSGASTSFQDNINNVVTLPLEA